jgi:DNA-directed RNA polymerase specialized sigma24 family protein
VKGDGEFNPLQAIKSREQSTDSFLHETANETIQSIQALLPYEQKVWFDIMLQQKANDLSDQEMADLLGLSVNAFKVKKSRILGSFRETLRNAGFEL